MRSTLCTVAALTLLSFPTRATGQESFTNEEYGYRIRLPKNYEKVSRQVLADELDIFADVYQLDRFSCSQKISLKTGWTYTPRIFTFWFPERSLAEIKKAELEAEKKKAEEKKDEGEPSAMTLRYGGRVYLTFAEYAKDRIQGFYFDEEKTTKLGAFEATIRPMLFEKLQNEPERWLSCALKVPGGEFAIVCSAPASHHDKLRGDFMNVFRSFKVTRAEGLLVPSLFKEVAVTKAPELDRDKMLPEEILAILREEREKAFTKALAKMEKGWRSFETDNFLVIYETDPRYAKQAAQQAENLRVWLEEHFQSIGDGFLQAAILRVYKADASAPWGGVNIRISFGGRGPIVEEIPFREPQSKGMDVEFAALNRQILSNWFQQKNAELYNRLPQWLSSGLAEYIEDADKAGGKLRFEPDQWERDSMVDALNAQKAWEKSKQGEPPLKDLENLLHMTGRDMWNGENWRFTPAQCASLVRFLVDGPGGRNAKTRSVLRDYIKNLYDLVDEVERKLKEEEKRRGELEKNKAGMSEEEQLKAEDEEYQRKRKEAFDSVEKELLEKAFTRTFEGWSESDWRSFQHSWEQFAEGRTR